MATWTWLASVAHAQTTVVPANSTAVPAPTAINKAPTSLTLTSSQMQKLSQLFKQDRVDPTTQAAIQSVLPNTPQQIQALKQQKAAVDQALQPMPIQVTQLRNTVRAINLLNNAPPPLLHLVQNYATSISFLGENGKPWPIENAVPGSEAILLGQPIKNDPFNASILVQTPFVSTNITFYLKGRVKPVVLFVHTATNLNEGLDSSVSVTLDGNPPGTDPLPVKNVGAVSDALLNTVDYAPGSNWQPVKLSNNNLPLGLKMWTSPDNKQAIVRVSSGVLMSPDWSSQASNPDNTVMAYAFNYVPLMLLVNSNDGQTFQVSVKQAVQTLAGGDSTTDSNSILDIKNISVIEKQAQARIAHEK